MTPSVNQATSEQEAYAKVSSCNANYVPSPPFKAAYFKKIAEVAQTFMPPGSLPLHITDFYEDDSNASGGFKREWEQDFEGVCAYTESHGQRSLYPVMFDDERVFKPETMNEVMHEGYFTLTQPVAKCLDSGSGMRSLVESQMTHYTKGNETIVWTKPDAAKDYLRSFALGHTVQEAVKNTAVCVLPESTEFLSEPPQVGAVAVTVATGTFVGTHGFIMASEIQ